MKISVFSEKCTGCRICELACSHVKLQSFAPQNACVKVVNLDYWGYNNPVLCMQCKDPACVKACGSQALSQNEAGIILLDQGKCTGCGLCVQECPIGAVNWDEQRGLPMICDLCEGKPVCVEWCPAAALTFNGKTTKVTGKGKKELRYSIAKGKRSLSGLNLPKDVFSWYDKFLEP
jgi:anaerobic carbon-monoxide dehydrogenase iron sulfur subunit